MNSVPNFTPINLLLRWKRASTDQGSIFTFTARSLNKEGRSTPISSVEDYQANDVTGSRGSTLKIVDVTLQHSVKRRIKKNSSKAYGIEI